MENAYDEYVKKINTIINNYSNKTAVTYIRNNDTMDKLTFHEIGDFIHNAVNAFRKIHLVQGDRVAIISAHSPWAVFMGIALTYSGITIVPIDASLPYQEIEKLLDFSDVRALFTTTKLYHYFSKNITDHIPCFHLDNGLAVTAFTANHADCSKLPPTSDPENDVIAILYSSGTTGQMKGVKVTYASALKARTVVERLAGLQDYMKYLLVLPFNHIAGFTSALTFFLTGCEIGFIEDVDSSKLQNGLKRFQPHCFVMVPKVYEVMEQKIRAAIRAKGAAVYHLIQALFKISGLFRKYLGINIGKKMFKSIIKEVFGENIFGIGTGASPCKTETAEFFLNLGLIWDNFYATTETNVPIAATGILDKYPANTIGNVNHHPEIEIQIKNADGNGIGEIIVKSELMMKGYFRRPDLTKEAFENGFFKTGDYGYIDKKGYLHMTGRIKESIILQNGKKVSPSDVDDYYAARISTYDIASRGIANEKEQYDEIHLFIANNDYTTAEQKRAIALLEEASRSAPSMYKLSGIHFVPKIPRTSVGKVKRFCLKIQDTEMEAPKKKIPVTSDEGLNISDTVCYCIRCLQGLDADFKITTNMRLKEDIGMDSLNIFEMCVKLDEKYNASIEPMLHDNITISEIIQILEDRNENHTAVNDAANYPIQRTDKDYKALDRFIKLSRCIWNFEVLGQENILPNENYIFCPNHESHFDGMWVIGNLDDRIKHTICSIAADYLFEKKLYRQGVIFMGGIPVHRSGNTTTAMKRAYECISNEGYNLLIHPEGTRTRNGTLGKFKQGAAKLSIESCVKIVPVCINGAYEIFPPHRKMPRLFDWKHFRRYPLQIKFGTPIAPDGKTAEEITEEIRQQIIDMKSE